MTDLRQAAIRDGIIARAVKARKIAPDRAGDYQRLYDADPRGIFNLLTAPVEEGGLMAGINIGGDPFPEQPTDYPAEWLGDSLDRGRGNIGFSDGGVHAAPAPATPATPAGRITMET